MRILITGGSGLLGHTLSSALKSTHEVIALTHSHPLSISGVKTLSSDLTRLSSIQNTLQNIGPDLVIHTAGLTHVDDCELKPDLARLLHVDVTQALVDAVKKQGTKLVHISTDHLFSGEKKFCREDEPYSPINEYARTKAEAEKAVLDSGARSWIIRTNFYGKGHAWRPSLSDWMIGALSKGEKLRLFNDVYFTPLAVEALCEKISEGISRDFEGILNVVGSERLSKYEFGMKLAEVFGFDKNLIESRSVEGFQFKARRPRDMSLSNDKAKKLFRTPFPTLTESLTRLKTKE